MLKHSAQNLNFSRVRSPVDHSRHAAIVPQTKPLRQTHLKIRPCAISASLSQWSIVCFTQSAIGTVRMGPPFPTKSTCGPRDLFIVITDGLTETVNAADQGFGLERIEKSIAAPVTESLPQIYEAIMRAVSDFGEQRDDRTLRLAKRGDQSSAFFPVRILEKCLLHGQVLVGTGSKMRYSVSTQELAIVSYNAETIYRNLNLVYRNRKAQCALGIVLTNAQEQNQL